ncbi:MAG TPA: serine hydrolase [Chloroflexota bacterium]|nr:serine hydrolase [Chloroflexota bacterium]
MRGQALSVALAVALAAGCAAPTPTPAPRGAARADAPGPAATAGVAPPAAIAPAARAGGMLGGLVAGVAAAQEVDEPPPEPPTPSGAEVESPTASPLALAATPAALATQPLRRAYRLPMQAADVAPEPAPDQPPLVVSPGLAGLVEQHLGGVQGVFGVAVKALDSGEGALLNADREFPAASLFKLPVMYEVFRQRDAGRLDLAERLVLTPHYADLDLGTLDLPVGASVSIADALERMIAISDNATANMLADRVGWASLNATARDLDLLETHLGGDRLSTSPRDMLRLLELIARGHEPSDSSTAAMRDLLLEQRVNDRLPAHLPPGTRVAHKTGNLGGIVHDVGIVYAPDAPFVIALLAEDAWDYGAVVEAEAALTRAVYDYLLAAAAAPTATPTQSATSTATPVPPRPTARRWQPPATTPVVFPTARPWHSPTPTATPPPPGNR